MLTKDNTTGFTETKELIHNYAKNLFISCNFDELSTMEPMTEADWELNYDPERDNGMDYNTFIPWLFNSP